MIWRFSVFFTSFLLVACFHVFNSNETKCVCIDSYYYIVVVLHAPTSRRHHLLLFPPLHLSGGQINFNSQLITPKTNNEWWKKPRIKLANKNNYAEQREELAMLFPLPSHLFDLSELVHSLAFENKHRGNQYNNLRWFHSWNTETETNRTYFDCGDAFHGQVATMRCPNSISIMLLMVNWFLLIDSRLGALPRTPFIDAYARCERCGVHNNWKFARKFIVSPFFLSISPTRNQWTKHSIAACGNNTTNFDRFSLFLHSFFLCSSEFLLRSTRYFPLLLHSFARINEMWRSCACARRKREIKSAHMNRNAPIVNRKLFIFSFASRRSFRDELLLFYEWSKHDVNNE